jgi:hypothetical protein
MKTFPITRDFGETQIGTITLNDDVVLMGDECLAWEATYTDPETGETRDHARLLSVSIIKTKNVLTKKETYGMEPSEIKIEMK